MAGRFEATVDIDRPIEEVFDFLADGENDRKFHWRELTKHPLVVSEGGYDLSPAGEGPD
jgi:uncharacterized protein YndB with AHSA1/START domain